MSTLRSLYNTEPAFGAYSKSVAAALTIPALSGTTIQAFDNVTWVSVGQSVFLSDGTNWGYFVVTVINVEGNGLTLRNEWGISNGTTIAIGAKLSPAGHRGVTGAAGANGMAGPVGPRGRSAYQVAIDNGFVGTVEEWLLSLKGEPGETGESGSGGGSLPTAGEVKTLYESNANTNAFTDNEKAKLGDIQANAEVNVNADWNATSGDAQILNKPVLFSGDYGDLSSRPTLGTAAATAATDYATAAQGLLAASATQPGNNITSLVNNANFINASQAPVQPDAIANFETTSQLNARDVINRLWSSLSNIPAWVTGATALGQSLVTAASAGAAKALLSLTKGDVGLSNADNTSDANKPVSSATQSVLDLKAPLNNPVFTGNALTLPNNSRINGIEHFCQSTKPTVRGDGSALVAGDRWWKLSEGTEWFWNGTYWLSGQSHTVGYANGTNSFNLFTVRALGVVHYSENVYVESFRYWLRQVPANTVIYDELNYRQFVVRFFDTVRATGTLVTTFNEIGLNTGPSVSGLSIFIPINTAFVLNNRNNIILFRYETAVGSPADYGEFYCSLSYRLFHP